MSTNAATPRPLSTESEANILSLYNEANLGFITILKAFRDTNYYFFPQVLFCMFVVSF